MSGKSEKKQTMIWSN